MAGAVAVEDGRIRLGGVVFVYLERTLAGAAQAREGRRPRPYGVAPMAASGPSSVVAAVGPREAVWLGFQPLDRERPVDVRVAAGGESSTLRSPPAYSADRLFGAGERVLVRVDGPAIAEVRIELVDPVSFERTTGERAEPLDESRGFGGHRLP